MLKMLTWVSNSSVMTLHNHLLILVLSGFCLLTFASCGSEKNAVETPVAQEEASNEMEEEAVEAQIEMPQQAEQVVEGPRKAVGAYRSVQGVMDPLSCYCNNGGYVDSPTGETVAVCFDNNQNVGSTDYIFIEGVMTTRTIDSNGPCPAGTMSYLIVESYSLTP